MHPLFLIAAALALTLTLSLLAWAVPEGAGDDAPAGPPGPPPQLESLKRYVGTWSAEIEMMGQTSEGVETCRMGVGGAWLITDFEGSFMGAPFAGHGVTGFDPMTGAFQGVWVDNSGSPMTTISQGRVREDGAFEAMADGVGMDGKPARSRHVTTWDGDDRRTFTVHGPGPDGEDAVLMTIRYARR